MGEMAFFVSLINRQTFEPANIISNYFLGFLIYVRIIYFKNKKFTHKNVRVVKKNTKPPHVFFSNFDSF